MAKGGGAEIGPTRLLGVDDEGQILALLGREGFCRMTHLGKSDSALRPCLDRRRHDECALSVELNRAERTELAALLSGGKHAARKLERAQIYYSWPLTRGEASAGLVRREPDPAHRRGAPADPTTLGQIERYDCEYRRNGAANLCVFLDAHRFWSSG